MTRGRISDQAEVARSTQEDTLAQLGNARVYLRLVRERVRLAALHGQAGLLSPALEDIHAADNLIQAVQETVAAGGRR